MKDDDQCYTECDRHGCHCRTNHTSSVNHLILATSNRTLICLCGDFQVKTVRLPHLFALHFSIRLKALLPVSLSSNTRLSVQHHVVEFSFGQPDLTVDYNYSFSSRHECGSTTFLDSPTGSWFFFLVFNRKRDWQFSINLIRFHILAFFRAERQIH